MDGGLQAQIQGVADERVPDRHLGQVRNMLLEELEVVQTQVMTGIQTQTHAMGGHGSLRKGGDGTLGILIKVLGKGAGVQLHAVGSRAGGGADAQ